MQFYLAILFLLINVLLLL